MEYSNFCNVYSLAITIYLAYVIVTRTNDDVYYDFCKRIVDFHIEQNSKTKTAHLSKAESLKARLKNRLEQEGNPSLSPNAKCVFKCAVTTLENIKESVEKLVKDCTRSFDDLNYPQKLSIVAVVSVIYSLYILIMAGFKEESLNASLTIPNIVLFIFVLYACFWDYCLDYYVHKFKLRRWMEPRYYTYLPIVMLIIIFSILYIYTDVDFIHRISINNERYLDYNYLISIIVCFSGFIIYLIGTIIITNRHTLKCSKKIKELNIPLMAKAITLMVDNYKDELDKVDDITTSIISESDFNREQS